MIISIAIGRSRSDKRWQNKDIEWSKLVEKLMTVHRTHETYKEYLAAPPARQDEIKDIGGFVGGHIEGGRRLKGKILYRSLITIDFDHATSTMDVLDCVSLMDMTAVVYSTHKHSSETPRLRLVMPLSRHVDMDEYEAIARKITNTWFEIDWADKTTFQPSRLMYWPSASRDGETVSQYWEGEPIDVDAVLGEYINWKDSAEWPVHSDFVDEYRQAATEQEDPYKKRGLIGAFCRSYTIADAIEIFLEGVYEPGSRPDRWSYTKGTTANGLVLYNEKFAYSHHSTDPISGRLCNAWDLVRLHKFGNLDKRAKEDTAPQNMPSFKAMSDLASKDERVRSRIGEERLREAADAFADDSPVMTEAELEAVGDDEWMKRLEVNSSGEYVPSIDNIRLIIRYDPRLKDAIGFDEFRQREMVFRKLPWQRSKNAYDLWLDSDDAGLRHYIEVAYGIYAPAKVSDALAIAFRRNKFHPVRDWLDGLKWDGKERLDTLLIDYMGAEDSEYVRAVTRKTLVGAVKRVFEPGCKFDTMLVIIGEQGLLKSTLVARLGGEWYSDTFEGVQGKDAMEQLQGVWLLEIPELSALKKAEVEAIKHFVSKGRDEFRMAYAKRKEYFPRQCIFIGTTNEGKFLKDLTGNRRFWPVTVYWKLDLKVFTSELVKQIWAEAAARYLEGEEPWLDNDLIEAMAKNVQSEHLEADERIGVIEEWLDTPVPIDWEERNIHERRNWWSEVQAGMGEKGVQLRQQVSAAEIWCEALGSNMRDFNAYQSREVHGLMKRLSARWGYSKKQVRLKQYGRQVVYKRL